MNVALLEYNIAYNWLRESEIGKEEELVIDDPFFQFGDVAGEIDTTMMLESLREEDMCFLLKAKLPTVLKNVYKILGSSKREFRYKDYTFFSLDGIKKACEVYEGDGQYKFCDIGMMYYGLGHVKVITLCRETGLLFIRIDGGSNGYDRDTNYNNFITLDNMEDNVFSIEEFIKNSEALGENFVYLG